MKLVTALVTALTVLGFAGAASACQGWNKTSDQTAGTDGPLWPKDDKAGA